MAQIGELWNDGSNRCGRLFAFVAFLIAHLGTG